MDCFSFVISLCHYASDVRLVHTSYSYARIHQPRPHGTSSPSPNHIIEIPCCQAFFSQLFACVLFCPALGQAQPPFPRRSRTLSQPVTAKSLYIACCFCCSLSRNFFVREARERRFSLHHVYHIPPLPLAVFSCILVSETFCFIFLDLEVPFRKAFCHALVLIMICCNVDERFSGNLAQLFVGARTVIYETWRIGFGGSFMS